MGSLKDHPSVPSSTRKETPKVDKKSLLNKFREDDLASYDIENEIEISSFNLTESPVLKDRKIDFLHSPFHVIENGSGGAKRPILQETSRSNQDAKNSRPLRSRQSSSRSRKLSLSSLSSSSSSNGSNSPKTDKSHFRNITPLNLEDSGRLQMEDTPVSRRAALRNSDFPFKKPLSHHRRIISIEENAPVLPQPQVQSQQQQKTPSNSRSTSPVKLLIQSRHQQEVSLTPAQRLEKHSGRLFSNPSTNGTNSSSSDAKSALDNYQFHQLLGKGASASVYKAVNLITDSVVAIKQIEINTKEDIELMMTEIRLLKILKHKNIVKYHGYVNNGQTLNIILEYCSGGSLRKLYKQRGKGLEEHEIVRYTREILTGLQYLHEQGVIHRDVKAANVLLTNEGTIKLADFGVSSRANHKSSLVVGGSPYWMAPEVILLQGSTTASDIWSLGATVVELFTTQPPYHEFDPMAACHAIGIEDNPPIPANIPRLAKDFLIECFQKSPELRIDAKRLLQHAWLNDGGNTAVLSKERARIVSATTKHLENTKHLMTPRHVHGNNERYAITPKNQDVSQVLAPKLRNKRVSIENKEKLVGAKSPFREHDDDSIGESDFIEGVELVVNKKKGKKSNEQLLNEFIETSEDQIFEDTKSGLGAEDAKSTEAKTEPDIFLMETKFDKLELQKPHLDSDSNFEEGDPFMELELEDNFVDPTEAKLISTVEKLVERLHEQNDNLSRDSSELWEIISKDCVLVNIIVRNHGLIRLLELLDHPDTEINLTILNILNCIFKNHIPSLGNFCTIGGITSVLRFSDFKYPVKLRLKVTEFIGLIIGDSSSTTILQMFISCGGLKTLINFVEEDVDSTPEFVMCGVDGIYEVFNCELPTSRSDFCYLLKDSIDWILVNLSRLIKLDANYVTKIVSILQNFSYSEPRVKSYIATTTLFKSIFKNYTNFKDRTNQLKILKFISLLSSVSSNLNILDASNCLPFLIDVLSGCPPPENGFKEIANAVCPTIFNLCHLNKIRQLDLVELELIPVFSKLAKIDLPFKDFILPILSELVLINSRTRKSLLSNGVSGIFIDYLSNPYWQVNSIDLIKNWVMLDGSPFILDLIFVNVDKFIKLFTMTKNQIFLTSFLELISLDLKICEIFANSALILEIFNKLSMLKKQPNAIIELTLLKILKKIMNDNLQNSRLIKQVKHLSEDLLISRDNNDEKSVLVLELMKEIEKLI